MKLVIYRSFSDETSSVQFHFVVPEAKYWYDRNVQPSVDYITEIVPREERQHSRETTSWSVPAQYWPRIEHHLKLAQFEIRTEALKTGGFRDFTRELTGISLFVVLALAVLQCSEIAHHLFATPRLGVTNRIWMFFGLLFVSCLALRFAQMWNGMLLMAFAVVLGPFETFHISNWWIWQMFCWIAVFLALAICVGLRHAVDLERKLDYWWLSIPKV